MKRVTRSLVVIGSAVLALIVLALIVVATFNWNHARPFINDKVSQAIGRPFAINGDLTVDWRRERSGHWLGSLLPWPEFTARDVRIANPDWAAQPQFARLDALQFRLSPLALLAHRIDVPSLQLVNPGVDLERDKRGRATWDFKLPQTSAPSTWHLDIGSVGFDSGAIRLDDDATQTRLKITVTPLQAAIPYDEIVAQQTKDAREQAGKTIAKAPDDKPGPSAGSIPYQFGWDAEGTYQGSPLKGHGKTGAVLALQDANQPFP
ncbi:MAG: AsmA family protein, partial [Rhodanobacter sp.]